MVKKIKLFFFLNNRVMIILERDLMSFFKDLNSHNYNECTPMDSVISAFCHVVNCEFSNVVMY